MPSPCFDIAGAHQLDAVNIGWYPYRVAAVTTVRTLPGAGRELAVLRPYFRVGLQSLRNPNCLPDPERRPSVTGADGRQWCWGYSRKDATTGWMCLDDLIYDAWHGVGPLRGPAGVDFEVGRGAPTRGPRGGCGKRVLGPGRLRLRRVKAREVYLRHGPHSTAIFYLFEGDRVKLLLKDGLNGSAFVEIESLIHPEGNPLKPGRRGWMQQDALGRI